MGRSSRILCFLPAIAALGSVIAAPTFAQARGAAFHLGIAARPMIALPRVAARPDLRFGVHPGFGRGLRYGPRRFGRGLGFGGYGGYDTGLGLDLAGEGLTSPLLPDGGYGPTPQWQPAAMPPAAPPPCIRPQIITIGSGLRHAVRSKVVYGARPPCGY